LTEIPEHLLRRSRERRAALGLGGDGDASDGESGQGALAASSAAAAPARPAAAATKAAPKPAFIEEPVVVVPTYVAPVGPHKLKIPLWALTVLAAIPLWAFFFPPAFSNHHIVVVTDPVQLGALVYSNNCSTCHGAMGQGGVGPVLHGGQAVLTFPNVADQINWVDNGSMGLKPNQPYGSATRVGGQHKASKDDMPAFANILTPAQISDVVLYERTAL
jgi:mono/diheme cytochrome c family protein